MEHNIEINGISICYEQQGSGRPVILLHGNGGSHHTFDGLIERLAAFYTVYAPDSRGHGHSGKAGPLSYEQLASDTAELIQALGMDQPMLYGFSDGGDYRPARCLRLAGAALEACGQWGEFQPCGVESAQPVCLPAHLRGHPEAADRHDAARPCTHAGGAFAHHRAHACNGGGAGCDPRGGYAFYRGAYSTCRVKNSARGEPWQLCARSG